MPVDPAARVAAAAGPPRVSVVVPAHEAAHCLPLCLDSVLAQDGVELQVVVVDDGSTDGTATVARRYGAKLTVVQQENAGAGAARNAGLALATGEYIAFLDADDYWEPGFLAATTAFLQQHDEAVAVLTAWTKVLDETHAVLVPTVMREAPPAPGVLPSLFAFWAAYGHVQTGAILLRRSVVDAAGGMLPELRISQDLEYWAYLATFGPWGFLPQPLYVNNSRLAARGRWLARYRTRRRLCPTVEAWQRRVLPRVSAADLPAFQRIRGLVAAGYAHAMILGGNDANALHTVRQFGVAMPTGAMSRLLCIGARERHVLWRATCAVVRGKEWWKAWRQGRRVARVGIGAAAGPQREAVAHVADG